MLEAHAEKDAQMKIGVDIRELEARTTTGIGRYLHNLITYGIGNSGHTFYLYGNQHTVTTLQAENIRVRLANEGVTLWWDQVTLASLARADGLDLFFSPYFKGPGRVECPLVTTIHDLLFMLFPDYSSWHRRPRNAVLKLMARWVSERASLVLTVSEHAKGDIQTLLGVDAAKIEVLPNSVDETYIPVTDGRTLKEVQERYGIEPPYVYYLGNFKPHKNVQSLLRAFASLPPEVRTRYELVLGTKPDPWLGECRRLAQALGIASRTRFIGQIDEADMPALYSGAELFVFPSLYEGFGLPPLEAMACGTAVVVSDRTSLPEVVGDAGCLVDPSDGVAMPAAMARILQNPDERRDMEARGLARAKGFRTADICKRQMQLLEQVAQRGSS